MEKGIPWRHVVTESVVVGAERRLGNRVFGFVQKVQNGLITAVRDGLHHTGSGEKRFSCQQEISKVFLIFLTFGV